MSANRWIGERKTTMRKQLLGTLIAVAACTVSVSAQTTVTTTGGTTSTVPLFTGNSMIGNSPISVSGGNVGIGTTNPDALLEVQKNQNAFTGIRVTNTDMTLNGYGTQAGYWIYGTASNAAIGSMKWVPNLLSGTGALYLTTESNYPVAFGINSSPTPSMIIGTSGNVGIGTTSPGAKLEIDGNVKLTSGSGASMTYADGTTQTTAWTGVLCGGDYAEAMNVVGSKAKYEPGDVLVLASGNSDDVQKSAEPYSTMVAGIYATKPGVIGRRAALVKSTNDIPMAMVGVVPTKVSAENGPIRKGDLLVTSSISGYAMRGTDRSRMFGAVIGKAMGSLDSGNGVIEVLVTLQ